MEPFDERGVIQRMGIDVRVPFLDRDLATDCIAMDVTTLRLQSLAGRCKSLRGASKTWRDTLTEWSEESVPQWRCCVGTECEASFGSFKALATPVLRHHTQKETVSRLVVTNQCPA